MRFFYWYSCFCFQDRIFASKEISGNGTIDVVMHNLLDNEMLFQLWIEGKALKYTIPALGTMTIILQENQK
jgi:hypothetical protein